jgi:hypothetical protein
MQSDLAVEYPQPGPVVGLLIINRIPDLPIMAISSILNHSDSNLIIGYVAEADIADLPKNPRISFINLAEYAHTLGLLPKDGRYESFDDDSFFSLVQLKWSLFKEILTQNPSQDLIYSDLDVFWLKDAAEFVRASFATLSRVNVLIQNFTVDSFSPQLCMGFVAFRNCEVNRKLIDECLAIHKSLLVPNSRTGDDDVITHYYRTNDFPENILQLPQSTFPVGNLLNLFTKRSLYPGLVPTKPYIYHANIVVGLKRKIETSYLFYRNQRVVHPHLTLRDRIRIIFFIQLRFISFQIHTSLSDIRKLVKHK